MSIHVGHKGPNAEKGVRYLALLDQALCNGNWAEVPELARKTEKHAPNRKCLTLTARSEAQIASASHRPTSASSSATTSIHGLGDLIPRLEEATSVGNSIEEDAFIASVCLAQIHWLREDHEAALRVLPDHVPRPNTLSSLPSALGWLEVCRVKADYIRSSVQIASGQDQEARKFYQKAIIEAPGSRTPELRRWTERLLGKACMYYKEQTTTLSASTLSEALRAFWAWNDLWQRAAPPASSSATSSSMVDIPRRMVWKAYYDLLSTILQHRLLYNPSAQGSTDILVVAATDVPGSNSTTMKIKQRAEVRKVEIAYETLLLSETQFPKAIQNNLEAEGWVEQVLANWRIFCGSGWSDTELGEGGKERASRDVLDILYRAATKTFHSTSILRELFTVHAALGEFDLAMHAFDSYVEIADRGKARAEKTGANELGLDNDDIAVETAAEAVRILCRYGDREQAEKAVEVGRHIQKWLAQQRPTTTNGLKGNSDDNKAEVAIPVSQTTESQLKPSTLATGYRAIGQSLAHWARLIYGDFSWASLQEDALRQFKRAESFDPSSIETAYAMALLQAEMRDVPGAIATLRRILATSPEGGASDDTAYSRPRKLLPCWHLLSLCLTARDQHESAVKMCDAAFEQFGEPAVLFGQTLPSRDSERLTPSDRLSHGVVDDMEGLEKENVIQIKMTQLALMGLMEGSNTAVDNTGELLGLYARLFGSTETANTVLKPPPTAASMAPLKKTGTLRSIAGSIRAKPARNSVENDVQGRMSNVSALEQSPPVANGEASQPPVAITVTNENGLPSERGRQHEHRHLPFKLRSRHHDDRSRSASGREKPLPSRPLDTTDATDYASNTNNTSVGAAIDRSAAQENTSRPDQPLKPIEHNAAPDAWPAPPGHGEQPPRQDLRLPAPHPASSYVAGTTFSLAQQNRHKTSLLVDIWLSTASIYLRAEMLDDAAGAIEEAHKLVQSFEADVAGEHSSAKAFFNKGWGSGKSVDELWADVWSSRGDAALARDQPFEAMSHYEQALSHFPDHADAIIGLSDLLMDMYEQKLPIEEPQPQRSPVPSSSGSFVQNPLIPAQPHPTAPRALSGPQSSFRGDPTPAELSRLAARDRAYMLLSNLTRLGTGWDNAEAWYTLARAHELSGQVDKAKKALWWVVELEETKPVRSWRCGGAGFTL